MEENSKGFFVQSIEEKEEPLLFFSCLLWLWKYIFSYNILPNDGQDNASENEELKSQIEEAYMLVEKLMAENAELVEKVNMQGSWWFS